MRLLPVALLLLLTPLSGCLDSGAPEGADATPVVDALSEKLFGVLPVEELRVAASDGEGLHNAVFRPDTPDPVPVFINFSPYWGDTAELGGDAFSQYLISEYVPRGYAVVLSAIRGTGHSEGCFQIGGDREVEDLYDVVDFFANQPWSNGNVAAGGKSYDSTTQNGLIAKMPHPALKGIFHVSGITDMYAYNSKAGLPYASGPIFNTYYYLQGTDEYGASLLGAGGADDEDPESLARLLDDVACTEFPLIQANGVGSGASGQKTDYWQERDWTRFIADSDWNGSIFFVHGLQDWNVKPDHVLPWLDALPPQVRVRGWLHQWQEAGTGHVYPMRTDWNRTMLAWLDTELKGRSLGFWDGPAYESQATDGLWRSSDAWPPAATATFQPEAMQVGAAASPPSVTYAFDAPTRLVGAPFVEATVVPPDHPDAALLATLYDEAPDGTLTWLSEAPLRLVYRDGLDEPAPYVPGEELEVNATFYPLDHVFEAGHKATVTFGGEARYVVATPRQTELTVRAVALGGELLPADADLLPTQPTPMECFTC